MKKSVWAAIGLVVIAIVVTLGVISLSSKKSADKAAEKNKTPVYVVKSACNLLTEQLGKKYGGEDAKKVPVEDKKTNAITDSNCAYFGSKGVARLEVRSPLNKLGAESNSTAFQVKYMPKGAQKISGYGKAAYWDPSVGVLNILKDNYWYTVDTGNPVPTQRNAQQAEALAKELNLN